MFRFIEFIRINSKAFSNKLSHKKKNKNKSQYELSWNVMRIEC